MSGTAVWNLPPKRDAGILVVHGIGNQKPGETLLTFCIPFVSWLQRRLKKFEDDLRSLDEASDRAPQTVEVTHGVRADSETPHHYQIRANWIADSKTRQEVRLLVAESHWADAFPPPAFADIFNWSFRALPEAMAIAVRTTPQWSARALFIALYPFLFVVMVALAGMAVLPFESLRKGIQAIQTGIEGSLGDAYQLTINRLTRADIVAKVSRDIRWLESKVENLIVVAHSQGAAVAALALADTDARRPTNLKSVITFGSGITKLNGLEEARDQGHTIGRHASALISSILASLFFGLAIFLTFWMPTFLPEFVGISIGEASFWGLVLLAGAQLILVALIAGLCLVASSYFLRLEKSRQYEGAIQAAAGRIKTKETTWLDLVAKKDLVSGWEDYSDQESVPGKPRPKKGSRETAISSGKDDDKAPKVRRVEPTVGAASKNIVNRLSWAADHTKYWSNVELFHSKVVEQLRLAVSGSLTMEWAEVDHADLQAASTCRETRWKTLNGIQTVVTFLLVVTIGFLFWDTLLSETWIERIPDTWINALTDARSNWDYATLAALIISSALLGNLGPRLDVEAAKQVLDQRKTFSVNALRKNQRAWLIPSALVVFTIVLASLLGVFLRL